MPTSTETFTGFRPEAIQFLADLAANNEREWFTPRKAEYERLLKAPLEALCRALDDAFRARGIPLEGDPTRSPFRIYRDVRFSKDKSPYKTNVAASFPWAEGGGSDGPHGFGESGNPGGYFHMAPGEVYIGGGMWHPSTAKLGGVPRRRRRRPGGGPPADRRAAVRRDLRRGVGREAQAGSAGSPGGPPGGRAAQAEGPDVRPAARR